MNVTLFFVPKKQTPGTVVFTEVDASGEPAFSPKVGTLYIRKSAIADGKVPARLVVTIDGNPKE